ncbi:hypothetical protein JCM17823_18830 [Halorubrum gandharaense]
MTALISELYWVRPTKSFRAGNAYVGECVTQTRHPPAPARISGVRILVDQFDRGRRERTRPAEPNERRRRRRGDDSCTEDDGVLQHRTV